MAYRTPHSPQFVGHMGHPAAAPPNTVDSAASAVAVGAHMVEIDVSVTADGEIVAIHGPRLDVTTTGTGRVRATPWDEVRSLGVVRKGAVVSDVGVPRVDDVVEALGVTAINFDLKDGRALEPVLALIAGRGLEDRCVVSGATAWRVHRVRRRNPQVTVLLNLNRLDKMLARTRLGAWWLTTRYGRVLRQPEVLALNINHRWATPALARRLANVGAELWVFTVDDRETARRLRDLGVHSITTNKIGEALADGW